MDRIVRINAGFFIIASSCRGDGYEIVFGWNPQTGQYVTWRYNPASLYCDGHYTVDFKAAIEDFKRRCKYGYKE